MKYSALLIKITIAKLFIRQWVIKYVNFTTFSEQTII